MKALMNFSLAFFHGEQVLVALALAVVITVIGVPLVFYVWLWHTKASERTLALTYAVITAGLCGLSALEFDPLSVFRLTTVTLAGILTLPWNIITLVVSAMSSNAEMSDREMVIAMLLGGGVNTAILFYLGKRMRSGKG
jgi:hypothetical protein